MRYVRFDEAYKPLACTILVKSYKTIKNDKKMTKNFMVNIS